MFFKAAFYDYKAHTFGLECRYVVRSEYLSKDPKDEQFLKRYSVVDTGDGDKVLFSADDDPNLQTRTERYDNSLARATAEKWLAEHYPEHKDPLKYW